ncbi:MAG: TIM44-like domain-containing protein [Myxococcota bacterium]
MTRPRLERWLVWVGLGLLAVLLLCPEDALARVGGGESFGRGNGGGGSGGSGGGGDGIPLDLLILLLQLCIEQPVIGVPLLIMTCGFLYARTFWSEQGQHQVHRSARLPDVTVSGPRPGQATVGIKALKNHDPGFSITVFLDFALLVHRRAHEALGRGDKEWALLVPFVAPEAREKLESSHPGAAGVHEVVVGGVSIVKAERRGQYDHLTVRFDSTQTERLHNGTEQRVMLREQWVFQRHHDARSQAPEQALALGCPSCGAAIEVTPFGACTNCGTAITAGQLAWQARFAVVTARRRAVIPEVGFTSGGTEGSVHVPMVQAVDLAASMRAMQARHPQFDSARFGQRVDRVYHAVQRAWSAGTWHDARPYVTDRMYQSLRFWVERYTAHGLRNRLDEVVLRRVRIVKVELDAWYESITVRIWGAMRDSIVDARGHVIGGNARVAREFSEYWTFLRAAGTDGTSRGDEPGCPNCGAPLDRVAETGICGYCDSKITTGRFDWVLSRIEQPEAYRG